MYYGDQVGLDKILAAMKRFEAELGEAFKPAALLENLVAEKKKFSDLR
jgi:3-hydroxyacyl-CoA dehydrogenase